MECEDCEDFEDFEECGEINLQRQYATHIERLLIEVCNEFMECNENGQFINHRLANEINKTIGIV